MGSLTLVYAVGFHHDLPTLLLCIMSFVWGKWGKIMITSE